MSDTQKGTAFEATSTPVEAQGTAVEAPLRQQIDTGVTIADPAPLGLAGFAMTTFVLSVFNAHLISNATLEAVVLPLAAFYGGLGQFMAGMWEFRKGNTFGALAFSSFGAFWLSFAAYVKFVLPGLGANAATATGLFLLAWTIFTAYMTVAAARVSGAVLGVFVFLTLTFLFLTIGALGTAPTMTKVGGWLGLVTAAVAWYASFAGVTNFTWKRTVLPVFPLTPARHR
ncbi:acetate uptake transporter [Kribbella solani]|uniref:Succinate-acetate transporter protein n=1 Tax=Kribbella solani TaxID=236067 RepID=A0A841E2J5_9ACTN|nr:acetate uptake transporter [Kribbella solani]MBB5983256.1 succinate-acetate transporter protein [Kribbella solani]MDX2971085.1 acetate uptake transporter [Kribbella solani]MDX3004263.1 acetate uptake transporter [Kribbella solani]